MNAPLPTDHPEWDDGGFRDAFEFLSDELNGLLTPRITGSLSDKALISSVEYIETLGRRVDALRVAVAAEVSERSRGSLGEESLAKRMGCRNANELLRRVTRITSTAIGRRISVGVATRTRTSLTGHEGPARFPMVRAGLVSGRLGVDSALAVISGLAPVESRANPAELVAAECELVAAATGLDADELSRAIDSIPIASSDDAVDTAGCPLSPGLLPCAADETKMQAAVWRALLDPDGTEPLEDLAMRRRGLRLGRERDGLVPMSGSLVATAAAQLAKIFDAHLNPRVAPHFVEQSTTDDRADVDEADSGCNNPASDNRASDYRAPDDRTPDDRTPDQRRHDVMVSIVDHAARSAETPNAGGMPATVIVTVRDGALPSNETDRVHERDQVHETDRTSDTRSSERVQHDVRRHWEIRRPTVGHVEGVVNPVSLNTVRQYACAGGIQHLRLDQRGRIVELRSAQRCFTPQQRRAIAIRDGGCVIPGCGLPSSWCEIHHVREHSRGGATHTDNGVTLCWYHHRTIDTNGWKIRMDGGVPHLKAPPWLDATRSWHRATLSASLKYENLRDSLDGGEHEPRNPPPSPPPQAPPDEAPRE